LAATLLLGITISSGFRAAENLYNRTGFHYNWDTTQASDGTHTITVRATDSGLPAKIKEVGWQTKVNNQVSTIYAANYFIHATDGGKVEGQPIEFLPDTQGIYHETGTWNNASQKDYWKSASGQKGFLSYGPYIKEQDLEAAFVQKNPSLSQRGNDWYIYRVGWELKVENNAFSNKPVASVDILASTDFSSKSTSAKPVTGLRFSNRSTFAPPCRFFHQVRSRLVMTHKFSPST
jgi:hypothetical protein